MSGEVLKKKAKIRGSLCRVLAHLDEAWHDLQITQDPSAEEMAEESAVALDWKGPMNRRLLAESWTAESHRL